MKDLLQENSTSKKTFYEGVGNGERVQMLYEGKLAVIGFEMLYELINSPKRNSRKEVTKLRL